MEPMLPQERIVARRRAFTLTEMAIVLGVVALILGAIWLGASAVWKNFRHYRVHQQILTVVQNIRDYYGPIGQLPPPGDITAVLDGLGIIPRSMRQSLGVADHDLSSMVGGSFRVLSVGPAPSATFQLQLLALRRQDCMRILMGFPVLMPELGVIRIGATNGTTAVDISNIANPGSVFLPIRAGTAAGWCNIIANPSNFVAIDFTLRN